MVAVISYTALHKIEPVNMPVWVGEVCETLPLTEKVWQGMDADGGKVSFLQPWGHGRLPMRRWMAWLPFMASTDRVQWIMKQEKEKKEMKMKLGELERSGVYII